VPDTHTLRLEKEIFSYLDNCLPGDKVTLKELKNKQNSQMYIEYIEAQISGKWAGLEEDAGAAAKRMYKKLIRIRTIERDYPIYLSALLAALAMYFMPNIIGHLKLMLIEDKRDWEILNYIYVFSIFGRLPPFNIKNVLINILVIADIYKSILTEALNNIKSGKGEASFDNLLKRVNNQELFELLEASMSTGLLNIVDNIDEMAVNQLKWLEIKSIKRRKSKQVIAMVPVVLVMLVAMVYFSYSLSTLSNPMNYIK